MLFEVYENDEVAVVLLARWDRDKKFHAVCFCNRDLMVSGGYTAATVTRWLTAWRRIGSYSTYTINAPSMCRPNLAAFSKEKKMHFFLDLFSWIQDARVYSLTTKSLIKFHSSAKKGLQNSDGMQCGHAMAAFPSCTSLNRSQNVRMKEKTHLRSIKRHIRKSLAINVVNKVSLFGKRNRPLTNPSHKNTLVYQNDKSKSCDLKLSFGL